jgi:hypothetical protein
MARRSASLDEVVVAAVEDVVQRTASAIAKSIADKVTDRLETALRKLAGRGAKGRSAKGRGTKPRTEVTKWIPDRRARRVPNFVIEQTGIKTKKAIVAKFGADAAFEKGKAPPKNR